MLVKLVNGLLPNMTLVGLPRLDPRMVTVFPPATGRCWEGPAHRRDRHTDESQPSAGTRRAVASREYR